MAVGGVNAGESASRRGNRSSGRRSRETRRAQGVSWRLPRAAGFDNFKGMLCPCVSLCRGFLQPIDDLRAVLRDAVTLVIVPAETIFGVRVSLCRASLVGCRWCVAGGIPPAAEYGRKSRTVTQPAGLTGCRVAEGPTRKQGPPLMSEPEAVGAVRGLETRPWKAH